MSPLHGRTLVAVMCIAQVCNLLPHVVVPAIMAHHLIPLWHLSAAQAGLMASAYAFGYMLAVPVLTALSDRFDARGILLGRLRGQWIGDDRVRIVCRRSVVGVSDMGRRGRGLRRRLYAGPQSAHRQASAGRYLAQRDTLHVQLFGWRWVVFSCFAGRRRFLRLARRVFRHRHCSIRDGRHLHLLAPFKPKPAPGHPLDFRPVIKNRVAVGYILGYGAHCFELYGMRTWIVSFWTFVAVRNADNVLLGPVAISVLITLLSLPASVLGNEAALRFGRHRAITLIMFLSAIVALAIGFSATLSPTILLLLLFAYGFTVPGDSGALTSGMSSSAHPAQRGATMALHSTVGFGLSALGAWGTGVALDMAGGPTSASGWLAAFSLLAAGITLGPVALWWSRANAPEPELK